MKAILRTAAIFLSAGILLSTAVAQQTTPPPKPPSQDLPDSPGSQVPARIEPTGPTVLFDTSMGRLTCRLFSQQAPETVANFIGLANGTKDWTDPKTHQKMHGKPLYNNTIFHRVIPEFMIQGGDPLATGEGDPGYLFKDEFDPSLNFDVPGRLAMANSGPNTNGSQFFITEVPTEHLNQKHTIFGQCDEHSVLIVQSITRVERDRNDRPISPVILKRVTIVQPGDPIPPPPNAPAAPATSTAAPASAPAATPKQ